MALTGSASAPANVPARMRVLVTGGAGFIGSSTALALADRHPDWRVVACDNLYRRGSELNLPRLKAAGVEFVHADVRQSADLERAGAIDALVECSAEPSVMASGDVIVPVNLTGAYHCFELAAHHGAQVIFLSTSRVYPIATIERLAYEETDTRFELRDDQPVPGASSAGIAEDFPLAGRRTMYGASKLAAELLLAEYDLPWVINRCGVVAGPWQMGKVDQGVFTHWMLSFQFGLQLSYIGYGGSGKQVRDLLHVADLVELVDRQLQAPEHWAGCTYNVGGGRSGSLSLLETSAMCRQITGRDVEVAGIAETRAGDVRCYLSDCTALYAHTDWRPRQGPREILADIFTWVAGNEHLVRTALL
jgi:CDP-paratose 2-epimerase